MLFLEESKEALLKALDAFLLFTKICVSCKAVKENSFLCSNNLVKLQVEENIY